METEKLLLTEPEAAKLLSISDKTLARIRKAGNVHFVPIGRAIRYELAALVEWVNANKVLLKSF